MVVDTRPLPRDGKYATNIVDAGKDLLELENQLIASGTRNRWPATVLAHMHTVLNVQQAQSHVNRRNDKTGIKRSSKIEAESSKKDGGDDNDSGARLLAVMTCMLVHRMSTCT
jgi:hypothetical protein